MVQPRSSAWWRSQPRRIAAAGIVAGGSLGTVRTARRVGRMRRQGRGWRPLEHDGHVDGTPPALRLVLLGDSAVAGHGLTDPGLALPRRVAERLARATGRAVEVTCHARSGADTAEVAREQVAGVGGADVVVVGVGVNDALDPRRRVAVVRAATTRLLWAIRSAAPDADLVLLACPDLATAPGLPRGLAWLVGRRCRATAREQARAARGLGVPVTASTGPLPVEVFAGDGLHPGVVGIEWLARLAVAAIAESSVSGHRGSDPP